MKKRMTTQNRQKSTAKKNIFGTFTTHKFRRHRIKYTTQHVIK